MWACHVSCFRKGSRIAEIGTSRSYQKNAYRGILRRNIPEPLIALLAFILGIWMWDHYFGIQEGYPPGTEEVALLKIDRDLRLSDAMEDDPVWMRRLVGLKEPGTELRTAQSVLEKLRNAKAMGPAGGMAAIVIRAETEGTTVAAALNRMGAAVPEDPRDPVWWGGSWWRAKLIGEGIGPAVSPDWRERYQQSLGTLRTRALVVSSAVAVIVLAGIACLPTALRRLLPGIRKKPGGYAGAWTPSLGLVVFMIGTLAWIGYVTVLDLGMEAVKRLPPMMGLALDTAARLLPSLIAVGFLFKQPKHAVRVFRLKGPPDFQAVLAVYALLVFAQAGMGMLPGAGDEEPGGGLSLMDSGILGLIFALVSACLVAPVAEEILYRGVLFRSLGNRMGTWAAAVVSAIVFSAVHFYDLQGFLSVGLFGVAAALLYSATGSLLPAILLHVLHNSVIKIPTWIFYHARIEW